MSEHTDARSRPGARLDTGTNDRELFLTEAGGVVLTAWEEANDYQSLTWEKTITQGKSDTFPIIGRKRDGEEHAPGEVILGGTMEHNDVEVTVDNAVFDAIFTAEIDRLMLHYDTMAPYMTQLGQSLSTLYDARVARMHIQASRVTTRTYGVGKLYSAGGAPLPNGYFHADVLTDPAKMEEAGFAAAGWMRRFEIAGGSYSYRTGHAQYLALSKYSPLDEKQWTGSSKRAEATVGKLAGLQVMATNHIPRTNVTTGLAKYQGDYSDVMGHVSSKMAVATLNLRGMKLVMKDQPERLGTLLIVSRINGHGILRSECSFEIATSDITGARGANHPDKDLL